MTKDARLAGLLLLPLVASALFSLGRFVLEGTDVPADEDYRAARRVLDEAGFDRAKGDAVAILPPWSLRPLVELRGLDPISGDLLDEVPPHRYRRLFLLAEPDAGRWLDPVLDRLGEPASEEEAGRVRVLRFDLDGPTVRYDFRERLSDAEVRLVDDSGREKARCDRRAARGWNCPGRPSWQRVERQWLLVTENGEDAMWAHPPAKGEVLELTYRDVPLGNVLVVRAGHTRDGSVRDAAPVEIRVRVGGEEIGRVSRDARFHFRTDVLDTARLSGSRADVTFAISTDDNGGNHFAFDAWTAREKGSEGGAP